MQERVTGAQPCSRTLSQNLANLLYGLAVVGPFRRLGEERFPKDTLRAVRTELVRRDLTHLHAKSSVLLAEQAIGQVKSVLCRPLGPGDSRFGPDCPPCAHRASKPEVNCPLCHEMQERPSRLPCRLPRAAAALPYGLERSAVPGTPARVPARRVRVYLGEGGNPPKSAHWARGRGRDALGTRPEAAPACRPDPSQGRGLTGGGGSTGTRAPVPKRGFHRVPDGTCPCVCEWRMPHRAALREGATPEDLGQPTWMSLAP